MRQIGKTLRPPRAPGLTSLIKVSDRGVVYNQKFTIVRGFVQPLGADRSQHQDRIVRC
jgi:hypothetical protein